MFGFYRFLVLILVVVGLSAGEQTMNLYDFNLKDIDGNVVDRYAPITKPEDIQEDIIKLLK